MNGLGFGNDLGQENVAVAVDLVGCGGLWRTTDEQWVNLEEDEGTRDSSDEK